MLVFWYGLVNVFVFLISELSLVNRIQMFEKVFSW